MQKEKLKLKSDEKSMKQNDHEKIVKVVMDWNSWYVERFLDKGKKDAGIGFG